MNRKYIYSFIILLLIGGFIWVVLSGVVFKPNGTVKTPPGYDELETIPEESALVFNIQRGNIRNEFYRNGPVAAHALTTSGKQPRFIVAFPAGNSGTGIWFEETDNPVELHFSDHLIGVKKGNDLFGVKGGLEVWGSELKVREAVLSNIRILRDYMHTQSVPRFIQHEEMVTTDRIIWSRERLDGQCSYELSFHIETGTITRDVFGYIHITAPEGMNKIIIKFTALTGEKPLTPIPMDKLLREEVIVDDLSLLQVLAFLSYEEKLLAGSWRFLTYFGRDSLLSLRLLMPVLTPEVIEAGLGSVFERLNEEGEVAHEEDIGEFVIYQKLFNPPWPSIDQIDDTPIYDYKMIDDDYILVPIVANYLLNVLEGQTRAETFLARKTGDGKSYLDALVSNLLFVINTARPFNENPSVENLISIKKDYPVGDWRDSSEGLGGGRFSYNVNAIFVPAALEAIARFYESGLFNEHKNADDLKDARDIAAVWAMEAPKFFKVTIDEEEAKYRVNTYAVQEGVPVKSALESINGAVEFAAVSLTADGTPVPILNSDVGFSLLFGNPTRKELEYILTSIFRPFPAGLITPVGLVVASPAYAKESSLQNMFTRNHYHGAVVWSWQQALLAAGLRRQIERDDLDEVIQEKLIAKEKELWTVINHTRAMGTSELWSWDFANNDYKIMPFGQASGHITESNAAQLWSTVYLAIQPPKASGHLTTESNAAQLWSTVLEMGGRRFLNSLSHQMTRFDHGRINSCLKRTAYRDSLFT